MNGFLLAVRAAPCKNVEFIGAKMQEGSGIGVYRPITDTLEPFEFPRFALWKYSVALCKYTGSTGMQPEEIVTVWLSIDPLVHVRSTPEIIF